MLEINWLVTVGATVFSLRRFAVVIAYCGLRRSAPDRLITAALRAPLALPATRKIATGDNCALIAGKHASDEQCRVVAGIDEAGGRVSQITAGVDRQVVAGGKLLPLLDSVGRVSVRSWSASSVMVLLAVRLPTVMSMSPEPPARVTVFTFAPVRSARPLRSSVSPPGRGCYRRGSPKRR